MNLYDVIYFIHDLENMGKKRIEFLKIHKSWQIKKVIGKVSVWTDSSAFFYHVFTNKRLHSCPFPLPLVQKTFQASCLVRSSLYSYYSIATCKKKPLVSRVHSKAFVTVGSSIFSLTITSSSGIFKGPGYAFAG